MKDHLPEYLAELLGTAIMMSVGIGAVTLLWSQGSVMRQWIPSDSLRLLITGVLFPAGGTAVVLSPLGQRSGGHLNPVMTLAFWFRGQVATRDALCYAAAQCLGAIIAVGLLLLAFGDALRSVQFGTTLPGSGYTAWGAFLGELVVTFLLVFVILFCVNTKALASKTPWIVWALITTMVFLEAPISGTSMNPARSLAPSLWAQLYDHQWIYWVAPTLGALLAVTVFGHAVRKTQGGCAKLFHTERYRCIFLDCLYTRIPAGTVLLREGEAADKAYVIEHGRVEVRKRGEDGIEHVLATLGPGDWIGEMALLLELPRSATVVAATDCELRTVTAQNFAHVIAEHPQETERLLRQLSGRLHEANRQLVI